MGIHQKTKSLSARHSALADTFFQLKVLNGKELTDSKFPLFTEKIKEAGFLDGRIKPTKIQIFQVNIGKL
jgi:hypothetical protein